MKLIRCNIGYPQLILNLHNGCSPPPFFFQSGNPVDFRRILGEVFALTFCQLGFCLTCPLTVLSVCNCDGQRQIQMFGSTIIAAQRVDHRPPPQFVKNRRHTSATIMVPLRIKVPRVQKVLAPRRRSSAAIAHLARRMNHSGGGELCKAARLSLEICARGGLRPATPHSMLPPPPPSSWTKVACLPAGLKLRAHDHAMRLVAQPNSVASRLHRRCSCRDLLEETPSLRLDRTGRTVQFWSSTSMNRGRHDLQFLLLSGMRGSTARAAFRLSLSWAVNVHFGLPPPLLDCVIDSVHVIQAQGMDCLRRAAYYGGLSPQVEFT